MKDHDKHVFLDLMGEIYLYCGEDTRDAETLKSLAGMYWEYLKQYDILNVSNAIKKSIGTWNSTRQRIPIAEILKHIDRPVTTSTPTDKRLFYYESESYDYLNSDDNYDE